MESQIKPSLRIWRSALNAIRAGGIWFVVGSIITGLSWGMQRGVTAGLDWGLVGALIFGGGEAALKHLVLHHYLWIKGDIAWNYARFLDYASSRILLRKVGGGYIFVHRLLLDYFANLEAGKPQNDLIHEDDLTPVVDDESIQPPDVDEGSLKKRR